MLCCKIHFAISDHSIITCRDIWSVFPAKNFEPGEQYLCADLYGDADWAAG